MKSAWMVVLLAAVASVGEGNAAESFDVAVTVDDLPAHGRLPDGMSRIGIAQAYLAALQAHRVPEAYGFVNGTKLQQEPGSDAVLDAWRQAGQPLGNHTFSHLSLTRAPSLEAWQADVLAGEPAVTSRMQGADWHFFRFPNLDVGAERRADALDFLNKRGYRVADVSLAFGDWLYTDAYARCVAKNDSDTIEAMKRQYLEQIDRGIREMKENSVRVYGRVIPQVLLTHLGGWSALTLGDVLTKLDAAGARYVPLAQAQSDPAYTEPGGGSVITRAARALGVRQESQPTRAEPELDPKTLCR